MTDKQSMKPLHPFTCCLAIIMVLLGVTGAGAMVASDQAKAPSTNATVIAGPVDAHGVPTPRRLLTARAASESSDVFLNTLAPQPWQDMLSLAAQYWNASPACPNGVAMMTMRPGSTNVSAKADPNGCRMWISTTVLDSAFARERCIIVVHEWGHLLGNGHSPGGIMAADASIYDLDIPICDALVSIVNGTPIAGFYPLPLSMKEAKRLTQGMFLAAFKVRSCKRTSYYQIKCKLSNSKGAKRSSTISRYSNGYKLKKK